MLVDNGKVIMKEHDLEETFNDHCINKVEKSSRGKPHNYVSNANLEDDDVSLMKQCSIIVVTLVQLK